MEKLKVGSIVRLSDSQTIHEQFQQKNYVDYIEARVASVKVFTEQNAAVKITLAQLDIENLYVINIEAEDDDGYSILSFVPDAFKPGNREDMLQNGCAWIFAEPEDVDNFILNDLSFSANIFNDEIEYTPLHDTIYGDSNDKKMFAMVHYRSTKNCDNTECLILEHGMLEDLAGGYIMFFQGAILNEGELEVIK